VADNFPNVRSPWIFATAAAALLLVWLRPKKARAHVVGGKVSLPPGGRFGPKNPHRPGHKGIDLFGKEGTPIYAAAGGVVTFSGIISGYGESVAITLPSGERNLYTHLRTRDVKKGDRVATGQQVGELGRTANGKCGRYFCTSPPHLHFEVITDAGPINRSRSRVDPEKWLAANAAAPALVVT